MACLPGLYPARETPGDCGGLEVCSDKRRISGGTVCLYVITDGFEGVAWNLCMATAALLMFCYIRVCTETTRNNAICCCCTAFIASEFAASFEWQIWCYAYDFLEFRQRGWGILTLILVYAIVFFVIWQLSRTISVMDDEFSVTPGETVMTAVASVLIFAVSNLGFLPVSVPFAGRDSLEIFNMRTLVDLGGLAILYAYQS